MTARLDHGAIGHLLRHFRNLPLDHIHQDLGIIYTHNLSSSLLFECHACIGANAVMALRWEPQKSKHDDARYWSFDDAPKALGKAYALSARERLIHRLARLGAPIDPFGLEHWRVSPFFVFEQLYRDRCRELGAIPA